MSKTIQSIIMVLGILAMLSIDIILNLLFP